jgi:flavin reductase (DIM6/NTAB) family NADH-FMN oxidoreductase RutF
MSIPIAEEASRLDLGADLKTAMRRLAGSVAIVTSRDADGLPHGMAASAVMPVSMEPPSMLVAVNRSAGLHAVLQLSRRYCINLLADDQHALLEPFSQSVLRAQRFHSGPWRDAWSEQAAPLPWLDGAGAVIECIVDDAVDYGSHTLFIGRVTDVRVDQAPVDRHPPLVWLAGRRTRLDLQSS